MSALRAMVRRELTTAFCTPLGWMVIALLCGVTGLVTGVAVLAPGQPASLRLAAAAAGWAVLLIAPALSSRTTADDRRSGLWEVLLSSPASSVSLVVGRWIAGAIVLAVAVMLALAGPFVALESVARPDPGEALCAALGVWLAGCAYLASGSFAGSLVSSPTVAYLLAIFGWAAVLVGTRIIGPMLDPSLADAMFALDPVRRLEPFVFGSIESTHLVYFPAVAAALLCAAAAVQASEAERAGRGRGTRTWGGPAMLALGCAGAALGIAAAAHAPAARIGIDLTRTRQFELPSGDRQWLGALPEGWRVTWVSGGARQDPALEEQVSRVLAQCVRAIGRDGAVVAIDPTTPQGAIEYARWFDALAQRQRGVSWPVVPATERGILALQSFMEWARIQAPALDALVGSLADGDALRARLAPLASALGEFPSACPSLLAGVRSLRDGSAARPVPDPGAAASLLARSHGEWAAQLSAGAAAIRDAAADASRSPDQVMALAQARAALERTALELRGAQDALESLPPDPLGGLPAALGIGGVMVVESPRGVMAVSARDLLGGDADRVEVLRTDRRARIASRTLAAMRALEGGVRPVAVIAHADERSILEPSAEGTDAIGLADALRGARIDVMEWRAGDGPRPPAGPRTVWIAVPPRRSTLAPGRRERALIETVTALAAQGEPVLLSVGPSLLPMSGQDDPWARVAEPSGIRALTDRVIVDEVPVSEGKRETLLRIPGASQPQSKVGAVVGPARIGLMSAVPLEGNADVVASAPRIPVRRIVSDWRPLAGGGELPPGAGRATEADVPVVMASERKRSDGTTSRMVVVGSPQWMRTAIMDAVQRLGGARDVLVDPGNRALAVASVLWLAGLDARLDAERTVEDVERVGAIEPITRMSWAMALGVALPCALGGMGLALRWRRTLR